MKLTCLLLLLALCAPFSAVCQQDSTTNLASLEAEVLTLFKKEKKQEGLEAAKALEQAAAARLSPDDSLYQRAQELLYSAFYLNGHTDSAKAILLAFRDQLMGPPLSEAEINDRMRRLRSFKYGRSNLALSRFGPGITLTYQEMYDMLGSSEEDREKYASEMEYMYKKESGIADVEEQVDNLKSGRLDKVDLKKGLKGLGKAFKTVASSLKEGTGIMTGKKNIIEYLTGIDPETPDYSQMTREELEEEEKKLLEKLENLPPLAIRRLTIENSLLMRLVMLYAMTERHTEAVQYMHRTLDQEDSQVFDQMLKYLSEPSFIQNESDYSSGGPGNLDEMYKAVMDATLNNGILPTAAYMYTKSPEYGDVLYRLVTRNRDQPLRKAIRVRQGFYAKRDEGPAMQVYERWKQEREEIVTARLALDRVNKQLEPEKFTRDSAAVPEMINQMLLLETDAAIAGGEERQARWQDVQASLKEDEVAIEFFRFTDPLGGADPDMIDAENFTMYKGMSYGAVIISKGLAHPVYIRLATETELSGAMGGFSGAGNIDGKQYNSRGIGLIGEASAKNAEAARLYALLWEPLEPHLAKATRLYYTPAGQMNRIPHWSLPRQEGFMLDRFEMNQLFSTAALAEKDEDDTSPVASAALFGGIEYGPVKQACSQRANGTASRGISLLEDASAEAPANVAVDTCCWWPLGGTLGEVKTVAGYLNSSKVKTELFTGKEASEQVFKNLATTPGGSPDVLHLATHAATRTPEVDTAYIDIMDGEADYQEDVLKTSDFGHTASMLKNARIAFADANLNGGVLVDNNLLASEILPLDLSGTRLLVLAACQTGLGQQAMAGESTYGLQWAVRQAGARYVIMSLWEVDDEATARLMKEFYNNWLNKGMEIPQAFHQARADMRKLYDKDVARWGAFVLAE